MGTNVPTGSSDINLTLAIGFAAMFLHTNILSTKCTYIFLFFTYFRFLIPALVFLGAIALTNHIVLFISYRALYLNGDWLFRQRKVDLWLIRIFVSHIAFIKEYAVYTQNFFQFWII